MVRKKIAIIGGGVSGCFFAINLKKQIDCDITIYEGQNRILKKLLQTGNGMCNITNTNIINNMNVRDYYDNDVEEIINQFDSIALRKYYLDLGLLIKEETEGRCYPYSKKASSVCDILLKAIDELKINVICDTFINSVKKDDNEFVLKSDNKEYHSNYVVFASGGKSSVVNKLSSYSILKDLGCNIIPLKPALVGFRLKENTKALSGIRIKCNASLIKDRVIREEKAGELIFKDDGVSGIIIMDLSRYYEDGMQLSIDLVPDLSKDEVNKIINDMTKSHTIADAIYGILPKMLAKEVIKKIDHNNVANVLKDYRFNILNVYSFDNSHVTKGGLDLKEIDSKTCNLKRDKAIYVLGELLDVTGKCGGYNLHFAMASAFVASNDLKVKLEK